MVGPRSRLVRPTHLGRPRRRSHPRLPRPGALRSLLRPAIRERRLRQGLRRNLYGRRPAGAHADRTRAALPAPARGSRGCAGGHPDLEQPRMSHFPILTLLIVLPVVGAAIVLFAGRHARAIAMIAALAAMAVALMVWTKLPADGTMALVEQRAWAPSLGIEYHLGVDGLGALMLVLSALVTLMSMDAAHRV